MKGDPLETLKKFAKKSKKKVSPSRKNLRKIFGHGWDSSSRPSAWQTSKTIPINLYAKWQ